MKSAKHAFIALATLSAQSAFAQQPQATAAPPPPAHHQHANGSVGVPAAPPPHPQAPAWRPPTVPASNFTAPRPFAGSNTFRAPTTYTPRLNADASTHQRVPPWMQRTPSGDRADVPAPASRTPTNISRDTLPSPSVASQPTNWANRNGSWTGRSGSNGSGSGSGTWTGTTTRDRNWRQNDPNWRGHDTAWRQNNPNWSNHTGSGDSRWHGGNFTDAYRRYDHHHHNRDWWRRNHTTIILVNGGYYYWDAGWWYPAWGYDPGYEFYAYDGPIYGYDGLPPDQVIANVQTALQQQGYYFGVIDGQLGPLTRQALAAWQRDHGLAITTAVDYPTMASLGLT